MKYSPYQLRIIDALKQGHILHFLSGYSAHYWIGDIKPSPSFAAVDKIKEGGMLELVKSDWRGSAWKWSGKG